ncbi:MAG TPA: proteasome activator [Ornithinicoccus sp.]|nr:proteasome activator [Ornithinicoccus sp.]
MSENRPESQPTEQGGQDAPDQPQDQSAPGQPQDQSGRRVVVVTQDGMGVAPPADRTDSAEGQDDPKRKPTELVEQPAKVMRLGTMIKQLLEEVKEAPLDEAGRARLAEIHRRSLTELEQGLAPELVEELERITLPLTDSAPSEAELRIAQAQLVGWLEGLFHGIQTAIVAQQMAAQQQLQQIRLALPGGGPGAPGSGPMPGHPQARPAAPEEGDDKPTGQYL